MPYNYEKQKPAIFSDAGQRMFLKIRDHTKRLMAESGAARCQEMLLIRSGGDTWEMLACIDRLVELGEIREIEQGDVVAQNRIFVET